MRSFLIMNKVMVHHFSATETQEPCAGANVKTGNFRLKFHSCFIDLPYFTPNEMHGGGAKCSEEPQMKFTESGKTNPWLGRQTKEKESIRCAMALV